jgi:Zn finger protein HypA/HybF involved in hydrogenase expression
MHEMAVALEICRIAEEQAGPAGAGGVVAVGVDVGDDSGLEVSSLEFCLEALLLQPPFRRAKPVITRPAGDVLRVTYLEVDDDRSDD